MTNWSVRELKPMVWTVQFGGCCYHVLMRQRTIDATGVNVLPNQLALKPWFEIQGPTDQGLLTIQHLRGLVDQYEDYFVINADPENMTLYGTENSEGPLQKIDPWADAIPEADVLNRQEVGTVYHTNEPTRVHYSRDEELIVYDPVEMPMVLYAGSLLPVPGEYLGHLYDNTMPEYRFDDMWRPQRSPASNSENYPLYATTWALVHYGPDGRKIELLEDTFFGDSRRRLQKVDLNYVTYGWPGPMFAEADSEVELARLRVQLLFDPESPFSENEGPIHRWPLDTMVVPVSGFGWISFWYPIDEATNAFSVASLGRPSSRSRGLLDGTSRPANVAASFPPESLATKRLAMTVEEIADELAFDPTNFLGNTFFPLPIRLYTRDNDYPAAYAVALTTTYCEWFKSLPLKLYAVVAQLGWLGDTAEPDFSAITGYRVYRFIPTYVTDVGAEIPHVDEPLPADMELVYESDGWIDMGLTDVQIFRDGQPVCPDPQGTLDWDDPPAGFVGDPYSHPVTIDGIRDVTATGLPPGLELDVEGAEVTGEPTQLGSFAARMTGFRINNGCPVSVDVVITIGACNPGGAKIIAHDTTPLYTTSGKYFADGWRATDGMPFPATSVWSDATVAYVESVGLVAPAQLDSGSLAWLASHGLSFDAETGVISGTFEFCGFYMLRFEGVSETNECPVVAYVPVYAPCYCPYMTDYEQLDADIVAWATPTVNLTTSGLIAQAITRTNIALVDDSEVPGSGIKVYWRELGSSVSSFVEGLPPGLTLTFADFGTPTWGIGRDFSGETPAGTYQIYLEGRVAVSLQHEGCLVRRYYRLNVS